MKNKTFTCDNDAQDFLNGCKYFLGFYLPGEDNDTVSFVHFIGYINRPTNEDIVSAYKELSIDEEFGLLDCSDDLKHHVFTREEMQRKFPDVLEVTVTDNLETRTKGIN